MKHEPYDSSVEDEQETKPVITARTIYSDRLQIVQSVIKAYLEILERPSISASVLDPESHQSHWTQMGADYIADVESTLKKYLVNRPDRVELREAWNNLLEESPIIKDKERRLVMSLGPLFRHSQLEPFNYFKVIKRRAQ